MKQLTFKKGTMISSLFIACILVFTSCGYDQRVEDNTELAADQNEAKFDDNEMEDDAQFLVDAAEINLEQIQLAQLAQQNGSTEEIRELGKKIESVHTKSLNDLNALADSKTITVPSSTSHDAQEDYRKLNEKTGKDFDKAYADMMVNEHKDAIDAFEDASTESNDTEIKNWASNTLPELRSSLAKSEECQKNCDKEADTRNK